MNQQRDYDVPNKTWLDCCNAACECLNACGNEAATNGETVQRQCRNFRKLDKFQHPDLTVRSGKTPEPSLFEHFPESKDTVKGNLADLTTELSRDFFLTKLLVELAKDVDEVDERKELLECYEDNPPSTTTVWRWMRRLGHEHCTRKKSFYIDGHERADQRFHRKEFTEEHLLKLEPCCCHQWLQVSQHELNEWIVNPDTNNAPFVGMIVMMTRAWPCWSSMWTPTNSSTRKQRGDMNLGEQLVSV
jgi:hypothetical protein